ncbi:hypothetical protein [Aeromicrobium wangtongii]|uniref:hypothetical protein n=1 Tax=Aeromicrobium wangtongii TaxID=2969247 RepID=UPI002016D6E9|nr:hypothetical protein [Aeromicrobium wangtongii]MCL3818725.1 hypothetical protein [Aeromicrobium wangtongii]
MTYRVLDDDDINYASTNRAAGHKGSLASALEALEAQGYTLVTTVPNRATQTLWVFRQDAS